ncbi:MAG: 1,4-alpha-glucan branching protein [Streptosporangiaceae bacterium]|nr:1,4-alpha-glucan branching protein [Streptosporangiaceae bacterium]
MAIIHPTTMVPGKLDLLAPWLPGRPWYVGEAAPRLTQAGGFRLDDPEGEVGLEFMAAIDDSGDEPVTYHLPLSYRGAPLPGGDAALIGTAQHGVLGTRWIYDGTRDPVLIDRMFALLLGEAEPQAQSISNTMDPSVTRTITGNIGTLPVNIAGIADGPRSTDITVRAAAAAGPVMLRVNRVLRSSAPGLMAGTLGHITAEWAGPGASRPRGRFFVLRVP